MSRIGRAAIGAGLAGTIALAIVWVITLIRGTSLTNALEQPGFWLVEGATIILTAAAILTQTPDSDVKTETPRSTTATILVTAAWTGAAAILIGVILAIATDTSITTLLTSLKFLIPTGTAIAVAILEAWPNQDAPDDQI